MQIKGPSRRSLARGGRQLELTLGSALALQAAGFALAVLMLLGANRVMVAAKEAPARVANFVEQQRARATTAPERLVFDVAHMDWQRIRYQRETALRDGIHLPDGESYVPASIRWRGENVPVRMRLKGVYSGHWRDDRKWSFQVKLKGDHALLGMKRFSIQHPMNRDFIYEWLFLRAVADEGLVALRFRFVEVVVNGEELGIYALAEHFGKRLIESNRFREGPIVGFDKDLLLAEYRRRNREQVVPYNVDGAFHAAPVDGIQASALTPGTPEAARYRKAAGLLEAFRNGDAAPGDAFDLEKMARAMALKAVFGAYEFDWKDTKFYYDPVAGRLQPIVAEIHHRPTLTVPGWWMGDGPRPYMEAFTRRFFADPAFMEHYVAELARLSDPDWLADFFERHEEDLASALATLRREFPDYGFGPGALVGLQKQIRTVLDPLHPVRAYVSEAGDERAVLEVASLQHWPLRLLGARGPDGTAWRVTEGGFVPGKRAEAPARYGRVVLVPDDSENADDASAAAPGWRIRYRIAGLPEIETAAVSPWNHLQAEILQRDPPRARADLASIPFVRVREKAREIDLLPGRWVAERNVILPAGYRVHAPPGFTLDLQQGAMLLSRSPLDWVGTEAEPIVITSSDGTGEGVAVLQAGEASRLAFVVFRGLGAPDQRGWSLTGAVTFYESDVAFSDCLFAANHSGDDLLNVVRSKFSLERSRLQGSLFDALDADFAEGSLVDTLFVAAGNDGVDLSGSHVELRNVRVDGAGDKAFSFGEASQVRGRELSVRGAAFGVAVKDNSFAALERLAIEESRVGLAVFQKKPEFGPALLRIAGLRSVNVAEAHRIETGSRVELDGRVLDGKARDVADEIYAEPAPPAAAAP